MIPVRIHEPELLTHRGSNGFYQHFLSALVEYAGARGAEGPRPLPRLLKPREHESCWVRWGDEWVFFDMSDHVQLFDLEALKLCSVYFKANLHRGIARRILREQGVSDQEKKLSPFLFFSESLSSFQRDARRRRFWRRDKPSYDICYIMGVYENPVREGKRSPFVYPDEPITPASYHFWIRWHTMQALRDAGIPGYYRLTSRGNNQLVDGINVHDNLSRLAFSSHITKGRITAVCTLPHALFPWKVSESFVLQRPVLIEQAPLTETPPPFMPESGKQFIELFPDLGGFESDIPLTEHSSYRVLKKISMDQFKEKAEWLRAFLADKGRLMEMGDACYNFAAQAYDKKMVAEYICTEVEKRIG